MGRILGRVFYSILYTVGRVISVNTVDGLVPKDFCFTLYVTLAPLPFSHPASAAIAVVLL